jgi:uncharacterized membrane-anchored protein
MTDFSAKNEDYVANKVPAVTLAFWVVKIAATTLGETGGDALSMSMNLGYGVSSLIFAAIFLLALASQVAEKRYHPFNYWFVIVATTTVGTTVSDYLDRTLALGYTLSSIFLFASVLLVLALWRMSTGTVSVTNIRSRKNEIFYWMTILASNTLGTALGDFLADTKGFGYEGGALVFGGLIALIAVAYYVTKWSPTLLFWSAFILTRPLGATLGDILTKPNSQGGLQLDRISSSAVIAIFMVICIMLTNLRKPAAPGRASH